MKRMRILHPAAWTLVDIILLVLVLVVILLVGCAGPERVKGSGVIAPPPPR